MVDISKILEMSKRLDEVERHKEVLKRLENSSRSVIDQHPNAISEVMRSTLRGFHSPVDVLRNPINDIRSPFRDILESSGFAKRLSLAEKSLNKSYLENFHGFQDSSVRNIKRLVEETISPFSKNNLLSEQVKDRFEKLRDSLSSPYHSRSSDLIRGFEQSVRATTLSSLETLSKAVVGISQQRNEDLWRQVSNSLLGYDRFANNTLAKLYQDIDRPIASALRGSLILANEQMLRSTSIVQSYIENSSISNFDKSNLLFDRDFPRVNRYRVQKQELLRRDDIEEDEEYESLVIKSPSAISFEQISNCMTLIGLCNEASETTRGNIIFTLTSTLWLSAWKLVEVVPTNKDSFAIIVDCLYLMLYEGAGKDKLRFIEQGYISSEEAELIWKIKHLRNKWLRHDINHGKESDIKKSHQMRKESLEWFGLGRVPYSKDEFVFLYNNLIIKVEEFLKLSLERVSKFDKDSV